MIRKLARQISRKTTRKINAKDSSAKNKRHLSFIFLSLKKLSIPVKPNKSTKPNTKTETRTIMGIPQNHKKRKKQLEINNYYNIKFVKNKVDE